ncbi:unnamed protein product [Trichogramma brassicae]|uniref:ABC transporter domain-containing protein n=1 Tax=Trichogramma brassicae TaxID=86971 RepID=A0A6H5J0Q9_9HYME|nr:unnamed protein product [Trichogramma brassicae]
MDILAGFTTSGVTGSIQVNGLTRDLSAFRRSSAYIMQDDNLQPLLTVSEIMHVAADLKLDSSQSERKSAIDLILTEMGLYEHKSTQSGRLSGGQKKRLAIALELISNPPIMFFDEPTSGLDSVTSRQCLGLLKSLTRDGRTIVCTIHQPSATLFDMIDHLYVLAEGRCCYAGGTQNLVAFLKSNGLKCPNYHNPADYLLEIINGDYGDHLPNLVRSTENGRSGFWRKRTTGHHNVLASQDGGCAARLVSSGLDLAPRIPLPATPIFYDCDRRSQAYYATGCWRQLCILLRRNALALSRHRVLTFTRLSMHLCVALLVSLIFYKIGQDAKYAKENFALLFFSMMFIMFSAFNTSLITFPQELPILTREHFNRWYKLRSFYLANRLADLPVQIGAASMYALVVYYLSGQIPEAFRLALFVTMYVIVSLVAQCIGQIVGTSLNVKSAVIFGPFFILPFMIFSGFFVHMSDAQPYLHWLFHGSFLKYGYEAVMVAVYGYGRPRMDCTDDFCYFIYPETVMKTLDMPNSDYWFSFLVLCSLYAALETLSYVILRGSRAADRASLLRTGSDPNLANGQGSTPLHLICERDREGSMLETFLRVSEEISDDQPVVRVDVEFFDRYKPTWNFFGGGEIARAAKEIEVKPSVSLDDLIGPFLEVEQPMTVDRVAAAAVTCWDLWKFESSRGFRELPRECRANCGSILSSIVALGFLHYLEMIPED